MKKQTKNTTRLLGSVFLLGLFAAAVSSCAAPSASDATEARVAIALETGAGENNVIPADALARYRAVFTPEHGDAVTVDNLTADSSVILALGTWQIQVQGLDDEDAVLVEGSAETTIAAGTLSVSVTLAPKTGGEGTFRLELAGLSADYNDKLDITLFPWPTSDLSDPDDLTEYTGLVNSSTETTPSGTDGLLTNGLYTLDKTAQSGSFSGTLPSGTYFVRLTTYWNLQSGAIVNTWTRLVQVWDGHATETTLEP